MHHAVLCPSVYVWRRCKVHSEAVWGGGEGRGEVCTGQVHSCIQLLSAHDIANVQRICLMVYTEGIWGHSRWCGRGSCYGSETCLGATLSGSCNKGGFNAGTFFAPKVFINCRTVCSWWRPFGLKCPTIRSTLLRELLNVTPRDIADVCNSDKV